MTAREMFPAIGTTVELACGELQVLCTVIDVKTAYGRPRLQVKPLAGRGSVWVELSRVRITGGHSAVIPAPEASHGL